jgi:hypothetical protein
MSMAMATRSSRANPSDARIPCPVCGQQIHPVAGRCKHCKTDLVKMREQQGLRAPKVDLATVGSAPVAAPAPSFQAPAPVAAPGNGSNGHTAPPPATFASPPNASPPAAFLASPPEALPHAETTRAPRWPLVVVLLAGIAILVCAYILLFAGGDSKTADAKKPAGAIPAPDRMETMPAPPPVQIPDVADPWTQPPSAPTPSPTVPDLQNPFDPPPAPPSTPGVAPTAEDFMGSMFDTMCAKAAACGLDQVAVDACRLISGSGVYDMQREQVRAGRCTYDEAKAARCLESIGNISCSVTGTDLDAALGALMGLGDCASALVCR